MSRGMVDVDKIREKIAIKEREERYQMEQNRQYGDMFNRRTIGTGSRGRGQWLIEQEDDKDMQRSVMGRGTGARSQQGSGFGGAQGRLPGAEESPWIKSRPARYNSYSSFNKRENGFEATSHLGSGLPGAEESPWLRKSRTNQSPFSGRFQSGSGFGTTNNFGPASTTGPPLSDNRRTLSGAGRGFSTGFRDNGGLATEGAERKGGFSRPEDAKFSEGTDKGSLGNVSVQAGVSDSSLGFGNSWAGSSGMGGFDAPGFSKGFLKAEEKKTNTENEVVRDTDPGRYWDGNVASLGPGGFAEIMAQIAEAEKKKWANLPEIKKNFYQEHPEVTAMFPEEVAQLRQQKNDITVSDLCKEKREIPKPVFKFEHVFDAYAEILAQLQSQFSDPTPIQCQLWPIAMSGLDAIGIAQTGSGKTLGFLLPAFIHIDGKGDRSGASCLVLTPTRELALQIEREVRKYHYKEIKSVCVYGGGDRKQQCSDCTEGVDVIIATPGRLNDLVCAHVIDLKSITFLVLDEADRMLDMGFEPQIKKILLDVRPDRHTIMTSATWPPLVREIAGKYTVNPFLINVGSLDLAACHAVEQIIEITEEESKWDRLLEFIKSMKTDDKALIFVGRKSTADHLSSELIRHRIDCQSMHGDRDQRERERALKELRRGTVKLLVATDVASRGLDIADITHVINYDFPKNIEEYVHRVGRTGRAGKTGQSITLMTRSDWRHARELLKILNEAHQIVPPDLVKMADRFDAAQEKRREERLSYNTRPPSSRNNSAPMRGFRDPFTDEWVTRI